MIRQDEENNAMNAGNAGAAKPVNPSSLFTSEGLQASYQDLDKIFENSDDSNDTVSLDLHYKSCSLALAKCFFLKRKFTVSCAYAARIEQTSRTARRYGADDD